MRTDEELSMNVLEFRQRSFQFDRRVEFGGAEFLVFVRTETESESQFRPRLVHLAVVVPAPWVLLDEANDALVLARDGATLPPHRAEPVVEVGAEPTEFEEQAIPWRRGATSSGALVYAPAELADRLFARDSLAALGFV